MTIENGTVYESNYARAAAYFLGTCAPPPCDGSELAAHRLITDVYSCIMRDPAAIGWKPSPDVFFAPWEPQKGREKDIKSIRDAISKVESLIKDFFDAVGAGEAVHNGLLMPEDFPALKKTTAKALAASGCSVESGARVLIRMPSGCADGLKRLYSVSTTYAFPVFPTAWDVQSDRALLNFSRCVFDPSENWVAQAFDALLHADGRLIGLCRALEARGYERIDCRDGKKVSLDYIKQHGKKAEPLKVSWAERTHSGIEVSFEELRREPCFLWIRMPMFKTVLSCRNRLPEDVLHFIADCTKTCDGCRYCVQTDKTHTRPLAAVEIDGKNKCPLFPGFTMNWRSLSPALAERIPALLDALDQLPELD